MNLLGLSISLRRGFLPVAIFANTKRTTAFALSIPAQGYSQAFPGAYYPAKPMLPVILQACGPAYRRMNT